jgi:hypothetical protein
MVVRMRFAPDQADPIGAQRCRCIKGNVIAQTFADRDLDTQLLAQFTGQCAGLGLTSRDLAPG